MTLPRGLPHCETSLVEDSEPERIVIRDKMAPTLRAPVDLGVIEIQDSDSGSGSPSGKSLWNIPLATIDVQLLIPAKDALGNGKSPISLSYIGGGPDSDIDTPMVPRTFDATRFAFGHGKPSQKSSTASASRLPSRTNTLQDTLPQLESANKPTHPKKPTLELSLVYTDKDIDGVLHCIACDAKWTTRKSSAQKSEHMRKCCKKAGYTQDTIDALLRKALRTAPPPPSKTRELAEPAATPTLLAVIQPPERKKRSRVAQATSAVTDVRETRDEIRSRALQFLQVQEPPKPPEPNPQEAAFPATQAFRQSRLGAARATKSLFATDDDSASEAEGPASTQRFGQSKLGTGRSKRSLFATNNSSGSGFEAENKGSPSRKQARATRASPSHDSTDQEAEALVPALSAVSIHDRPRVGRPKSKSPKRPKKVKATPAKAVYGATWEEQLRNKILENKELHMRILRFQPICRADVLNLLDAGDNADARLLKHLDAFLDKEGIHVSTLMKWGKKKS